MRDICYAIYAYPVTLEYVISSQVPVATALLYTHPVAKSAVYVMCVISVHSNVAGACVVFYILSQSFARRRLQTDLYIVVLYFTLGASSIIIDFVR